MKNSRRIKAGIFSVRKEEWASFMEIMVDSAENFSTWENWKIAIDQNKVDLGMEGVEAVEIAVDLDVFKEWCSREGLPLDGSARARFAGEALQEQGS